MAKKKATKKAPVSPTPRDACFVLMPFGGWLDDYYEAIYRPAIDAGGLEPHRADDLFRPSTIVNDIWAYTKRSKLLLADLSGKNPNVFYELGLAHALGKPVILIAESMDEIPFDLRALRIIVYDKNAPDWGRVLHDKIQAAIKEVLKSPVAAVLPAFLEVKAEPSKPTVTPHEKELIEIKQELDLLRREVRTREVIDTSTGAEPLGPDEARTRIMEYVRMGMPDRMIVERLRRSLVPTPFVIEEIPRARMMLTAKKRRVPRRRKASQ